MRIAKLVTLFVVSAVLSVYVCAQTSTSSLRGTVSDPNGAVLRGATVTIANPATGSSRTTKTDSQGVYQSYYSTRAQSYQTKGAPFETVEELRLVYGGDYDILVGEDAHELDQRLRSAEAQVHPAAVGRELDGVDEQVPDDLLQTRAVPDNHLGGL